MYKRHRLGISMDVQYLLPLTEGTSYWHTSFSKLIGDTGSNIVHGSKRCVIFRSQVQKGTHQMHKKETGTQRRYAKVSGTERYTEIATKKI